MSFTGASVTLPTLNETRFSGCMQTVLCIAVKCKSARINHISDMNFIISVWLRPKLCILIRYAIYKILLNTHLIATGLWSLLISRILVHEKINGIVLQ